jgi:glycosyltransferase involved in cell wall biosynthesis
MKIAMIHSPILGRGGGERQILTLASQLQKRGHVVEIFVSALDAENSYPDLIKELNVTVIPHPLGRRMPRWLTPMDSAQKTISETKEESQKSFLREWMRKAMGRQFYTIPYELPTMINIGRKIPKGFDVINCHNYPSEWAAFFAKKNLNAPIVWMCNEPPFWFFVPELRQGLRRINAPIYEVFDKTAVNYIDEILVLSNIASGYVIEAYNRTSKVVRSGVDVDRFSKSRGKEIREKYQLENCFVLLQVGNIELNKRQIDAIKALQMLSKSHDDVRLIFDGGGRKEEIMRLCEKYKVIDKVVFLRSSSDEKLADVYASCDAFIFPAQITWGLAVIEAMAEGKPVIVSNRCGASEIIKNGENGLIVDHAKPAEIAVQIEKLINDPEFRKRIGENAKVFVKDNLSWQKYAEQMEKSFEKTVQAYRK